MQKITPNLWFDHQAEEAVHFYLSIFKNSKILSVAYYGAEGAKVSGRPQGTVMTIAFELDGQEFIALNGGPIFQFSPAISLMVDCETQEEVDHFWKKLSEDGREDPCGWLQDKYGVSWQIVPKILGEMMRDPDVRKSENVMKTMVQMRKLDIKTLSQAYERS